MRLTDVMLSLPLLILLLIVLYRRSHQALRRGEWLEEPEWGEQGKRSAGAPSGTFAASWFAKLLTTARRNGRPPTKGANTTRPAGSPAK